MAEIGSREVRLSTYCSGEIGENKKVPHLLYGHPHDGVAPARNRIRLPCRKATGISFEGEGSVQVAAHQAVFYFSGFSQEMKQLLA